MLQIYDVADSTTAVISLAILLCNCVTSFDFITFSIMQGISVKNDITIVPRFLESWKKNIAQHRIRPAVYLNEYVV